jgi:hypothetical protein
MDSELDRLGEQIAEQAAHLDAATHQLLVDLREFDERGGWYAQGALSCAHWLSWRIGWTLATARDHVRVARKLPETPAISDALRRGEVSYSKVRAMLRIATPSNEALLLDYARFMTASQLEETCRKYALVLRHGQDPHPLGDLQRRCVRRRDTEDGMVKIEAVLHPEEAELIWTMLTHAAGQLVRSPRSSTPADPTSNHASAETRAIQVIPAATSIYAGGTEGDVPADPRQLATESRSRDSSSAVPQSSEPGQSIAKPDTSPHSKSLLDRLLDEAEVLCAAEPAPEGSEQSSGNETRTSRATSVLHRRADAVQRAFSRADALVALAQGYLRGDRPNRAPIEVVLTISASSLRTGGAQPLGGSPAAGGSQLEGGLHAVEVGELGESFVSCEAARRLSCDSGVVDVIVDDHGVPLSVGRKRRTMSGQLKRALLERDKTCTFPGCTNRLFLEAHHIKHWADGGETSLRNGCLLCSTHHHYVHEYKYTIELDPDQRPQYRDPHGRLVVAVPERPVVSDLGWPSIRAANQPLAISADTNACKWDGNPVDYGAVIGYLVVADGLN